MDIGIKIVLTGAAFFILTLLLIVMTGVNERNTSKRTMVFIGVFALLSIATIFVGFLFWIW